MATITTTDDDDDDDDADDADAGRPADWQFASPDLVGAYVLPCLWQGGRGRQTLVALRAAAGAMTELLCAPST